jgi:predicted site-specific integrase-resolvase
MRRFKTFKEVKEELGICTPTLKDIIKRGDVLAIKTSPRGSWRISAESLEEFTRRGPKNAV